MAETSLRAVSVTRQALQQLEDQLTCSICFNAFKKPKLLNCAHVFCQGCIQQLVRPARRGRSLVTCPFCSKETTLPEGGVTALQDAFYLNSLTEIQDTLGKVEEGESEDPAPSAPYREEVGPIVVCSIHGKELELYCETCSVMICVHCTVKEHCGHQFGLKDEAKVSEMGKELLQLIRVAEDQNRQVMDQRSVLVAKIGTLMDQSLLEMKLKMANQVNEVYYKAQEKLKEMIAVKDEIQKLQNELKNVVSKDQVATMQAKIAACMQKLADLKAEGICFTRQGAEDENSKIYVSGSGMGFTVSQVSDMMSYPLDRILFSCRGERCIQCMNFPDRKL